MAVKLITGDETYMIVYPAGDRSRLLVKSAGKFDPASDVIAADRIMDDREEAEHACADLAAEHALERNIDPRMEKLELRHRTGEEIFYIVVLQGAGSDTVSVAQAQWFDVYDYRLASDRAFDTPEAAEAEAAAVAFDWELAFVPYGWRPGIGQRP